MYLSVCCTSIHPYFHFLDDNLSKYQWFFTKLGVCIDIVEIWYGIVNGQVSSIFDSYLPVTGQYFHFQMITLVNVNGFSLNLVCIDIVEICFGIIDGQISSVFDRVICPRYIHIFIPGQ